MDLFKAIFGDSSSSESSDSEVDQGHTLPTPTDAAVVPPQPDAASVTEPILYTSSVAMGTVLFFVCFTPNTNIGVCAEIGFLL